MKWRWRVMLVLVIAAAVVVVAAGCGGSKSGVGSAIIGVGGGQLQVGGIILIVPPGALPGDTAIAIVPLTTAQVPALPAGQTLLSAAQFAPDGLLFDLPVSITLPLSSPLPAGQQNVVVWTVSNSSVWQDSGFRAVVSSDGNSAVTSVTHFSIYAIFGS